MGKDNKGKELGTGLSQRKDGRYSARFVTRSGKRIEKYFEYFQEARKWLAEMREEDDSLRLNDFSFITLDEWFDYYIKNIKRTSVRESTLRGYKSEYRNHVREKLGALQIRDIKSMHIQKLLNEINEEGLDGAMISIRMMLSDMFKHAMLNDIIQTNPVKKVQPIKPKIKKEPRVLSVEEQRDFLRKIKGCPFQLQYEFVLQTGVRAGEMIGLRWDDVDFLNKRISIERTMSCFNFKDDWAIGPPKSKSSKRIIPMTEECTRILNAQKEKNIEKAPDMFGNLVFSRGNMPPYTIGAYDYRLRVIADRMEVERFSMHTLRHTFATRCVEAGLKPKTVQRLLGYGDVALTLNLYVHVLEDEKAKEMQKFEEHFSGVL